MKGNGLSGCMMGSFDKCVLDSLTVTVTGGINVVWGAEQNWGETQQREISLFSV